MVFCCCRKKLESRESDEPTTHWYSIYLCILFVFFDGIQYSMFFVSMWPYLKTIDPNATATFFGLITASFSLGQTITSPLFGFWMNKVKSIKPPLTISMTMMMISNLIYASMELFPYNRRYIMLAARFFIGLAAGDVAVVRAYSASATTPKDRPRAVVMASASWTFGLVVGPAIPVIFSPIGYPGWKLFGHLHFDMYTAPAWASFICNIISLFLLHKVFREVYAGVAPKDDNIEGATKEEPPINKLGAFVCIISRFALQIVFTNNETIGSLFSMAMYNWTNVQAVKYYGLITLAQAGVDSVLSILFVTWLGQALSKRRLERIATIFGLSCMLFFHILTFPWSFWPNKLKYDINHINQTVTEITGCYTQTYSWCPSTHQVPLALYVFSMVFLMAVSLAMSFLPINILYSKILGNTRQGTMTGILFMAGALARTIGPIVVSFLFDHYGPEATWGMEMVVLGVTIGIWVVFYRKIEPYEASHKHPESLGRKDSIISTKTESLSIERL